MHIIKLLHNIFTHQSWLLNRIRPLGMQTTELPSAISDTTLHAMRIINDLEICMYAFLLVTGINLIHQLLLLFMVVAFELSVELMRAFSFGVSLGF